MTCLSVWDSLISFSFLLFNQGIRLLIKTSGIVSFINLWFHFPSCINTYLLSSYWAVMLWTLWSPQGHDGRASSYAFSFSCICHSSTSCLAKDYQYSNYFLLPPPQYFWQAQTLQCHGQENELLHSFQAPYSKELPQSLLCIKL